EVEAARRLEEREGGDDGQDHPQDRARRAPRREPEQENEDEEADAAHGPERHAPAACAQYDGGQEDRELEPETHLPCCSRPARKAQAVAARPAPPGHRPLQPCPRARRGAIRKLRGASDRDSRPKTTGCRAKREDLQFMDSGSDGGRLLSVRCSHARWRTTKTRAATRGPR